MSEPSLPPPNAALLKAVRRMLRPLVRLLMRHGVTFPVLADLLRTLFVDVAANDLLSDPRSRTDSRISVMTGVHRKEIRRLRSEPLDGDPVPDTVTLGSQVIARWLAAEGGGPAPLPRVAGQDEPSFERLIASITTDVRPRAVLADWLSQGLVTLDAQDRVHLNMDAFIPRPGDEAQLFFFARNLHDHIAAAAANISAADRAPFMDRAVHYDQLHPAVARRLEQAARAAATRALLGINRLALDLVDEAGVGAGALAVGSARVNFGVYVFTEPPPK
jgi:hypothetical protein